MSSFPNIPTSNIFNTADYNIFEAGLTIEQANRLYLSLGGGTIGGDLNLLGDYYKNSLLVDLNAITGVSAGTATANKALILDGAKEISTLNAITSNTYYGTTANIQLMNTDILSSVENVNVLRTSNGDCFIAGNGVVSSAIHCLTNSCHIGTTSNHNFNVQANGSNVLQCLATGVCNIVNSLQIGGTTITSSATELNYNDITTIGTGQASKTLVLDASRNITNINSITTSFLNFGTNITGSTTTGNITGYKLSLGEVVNNFGMLSICGSTAVDSQSWGADNCILSIENSNTSSTIKAEINVSSGLASTSTNPLRMGTITNNDFVLFTNSTERCRLRTDGAFLIDSVLQIRDSTDTSRLISALDSTMETDDKVFITFGKLNANGNQAELAFLYYSSNSDNNAMLFGFYGGESMRMYKDKCLCINSTVKNYQSSNSRLNIVSPGTEWCSIFKTSTAGANQMIGFYSSADVKQGGISFGAGSTTFNTSSDYRLKKNITPLEKSLEIVNKLKPCNFTWLESSINDFGFIAHEIQEFLPQLVQGEKDEIDKQGNINPQSVDYGKLTPVLVSAIQELSSRLKKLEDFIATLDIEEVPI